MRACHLDHSVIQVSIQFSTSAAPLVDITSAPKGGGQREVGQPARLRAYSAVISPCISPSMSADVSAARREKHRRKGKEGTAVDTLAEDSPTPAPQVGDAPLYLQCSTMRCLLLNHCVPCLYKIFPEGAQDPLTHRLREAASSGMEKQGAVPTFSFPRNQRPEMCPRSGAGGATAAGSSSGGGGGGDGLYRCSQRLLTLGDGDFTFSLCLAQSLLRQRQRLARGSDADADADGDADYSQLVATSHESHASVCSTYTPYVQDVLKQLREAGQGEGVASASVTVLHCVDATCLRGTAELLKPAREKTPKVGKKGKKGKEGKEGAEAESEGTNARKPRPRRFDRIIWNFPCISLAKGVDGQAADLLANKELLGDFFRNVGPFLRRGGRRVGGDGEGDGAGWSEVHLTHKTVEPFCWWGLQTLGAGAGYLCAYRVCFDKCAYPGYTNRKALDRKSFPCNDAQTYVFVQAEQTEGQTKTGQTEGQTHGGGHWAAAMANLRLLVREGVLCAADDPLVAGPLYAYLCRHCAETGTDAPGFKRQKLGT